jgi:hypothetical protein
MFRTLQISLIKGHVNATTSRFFYFTAVALICVLSLQLTACGSTSTSQGSGQTTPQITSPTPTSEASPTPTQASQPTPIPTQASQPTPPPTLVPSDPTAFVIHEDGGSLSFPIDGSFAPLPIHLSNESNTSGNNCCAPLNWSATVDPQGSWLSLSQYSGSVPAGANQDILVHFSIANLCSQQYTGTVTFTTPLKADRSNHYVDIFLDLTSTSSVPLCVTPSPSPSSTAT